MDERSMLRVGVRSKEQRVERQVQQRTPSERAIIEATHCLLDAQAARDLSVAAILSESGVSRATFYHYFGSKWDVVNLLAAAAMGEIYELVRDFTGSRTTPRRDALRATIEQGCSTWAAHGAVMRSVLDHWREVPELREMLNGVLAPFQVALAQELDRERAAGIAPAGPDSQPLVAAMLWASLTCLHVSGLADVREISDAPQAAELLNTIWMRTLYGQVPAQ